MMYEICGSFLLERFEEVIHDDYGEKDYWRMSFMDTCGLLIT